MIRAAFFTFAFLLFASGIIAGLAALSTGELP